MIKAVLNVFLKNIVSLAAITCAIIVMLASISAYAAT